MFFIETSWPEILAHRHIMVRMQKHHIKAPPIMLEAPNIMIKVPSIMLEAPSRILNARSIMIKVRSIMVRSTTYNDKSTKYNAGSTEYNNIEPLKAAMAFDMETLNIFTIMDETMQLWNHATLLLYRKPCNYACIYEYNEVTICQNDTV